uniref:Uncharacterized protein n=1 Tax=Caenorhabditis japonica TaxID=281687 RepID=A0A8R1INK6_CAEJA
RWIKGKHVDDFTEALLWNTRHYDQAKILSGIEYRPWDDAFEEESRGFCEDFRRVCGRGTCFQISSKIDPYASLTLAIYEERVSIQWSGTRQIWKGGDIY